MLVAIQDAFLHILLRTALGTGINFFIKIKVWIACVSVPHFQPGKEMMTNTHSATYDLN
jgi:hypothetical protein